MDRASCHGATQQDESSPAGSPPGRMLGPSEACWARVALPTCGTQMPFVKHAGARGSPRVIQALPEEQGQAGAACRGAPAGGTAFPPPAPPLRAGGRRRARAAAVCVVPVALSWTSTPSRRCTGGWLRGGRGQQGTRAAYRRGRQRSLRGRQLRIVVNGRPMERAKVWAGGSGEPVDSMQGSSCRAGQQACAGTASHRHRASVTGGGIPLAARCILRPLRRREACCCGLSRGAALSWQAHGRNESVQERGCGTGRAAYRGLQRRGEVMEQARGETGRRMARLKGIGMKGRGARIGVGRGCDP